MTIDQATIEIINKELEPFGIDMDYVRKNPIIGDVSWYHYYTFKSKEEYDNWKDFAYATLKKVKPKLTKKTVDSTFIWIDLLYGLKQEYDGIPVQFEG